jgi:hypothetical protein
MTKNTFLVSFIILFCTTIYSCSISKNTMQIKLRDIDSTIRTVIPKHNCGCDWKEQKTNTFISPILKTYGYLFQTIYVKTIDSIDLMNDSKKVYLALQKLDNHIGRQKRFFLEYKTPIENDTTKANIIGTWFHFKSYCEGYVIGVSAKELEKNSVFKIDREKLCE